MHSNVFSLCSKEALKGEAKVNAERLPDQVEFTVGETLPEQYLSPGTILVDCLLGTGIKGAIKEPYAAIIHQVNNSNLPVIAMAMPSGIDADTGEIETVGIKADLTITIGLPKPAMFLGKGKEFCGRIRLVQIGIPLDYIERKPSVFKSST